VLAPRISDGRGWCCGSSFFVVGSAFDEASGESLPDYGVGVNNDGVLECRVPSWRRFVAMLPVWSLSSR
jgi:hypothetical protein